MSIQNSLITNNHANMSLITMKYKRAIWLILWCEIILTKINNNHEKN